MFLSKLFKLSLVKEGDFIGLNVDVLPHSSRAARSPPRPLRKLQPNVKLKKLMITANDSSAPLSHPYFAAPTKSTCEEAINLGGARRGLPRPVGRGMHIGLGNALESPCAKVVNHGLRLPCRR